MNQKGFTLSLDRTDVNRAPLSRNQLIMLVLVVAAVLAVTATIFLSVSAANSNISSEMAVGTEADTARWIAMGEHFGAKAFDAERSAATNTARWTAMGKHYGSKTFDAERSAAVNTARWTAMGAHYAVDNSAAAEAHIARYEAMAEWYTR